MSTGNAAPKILIVDDMPINIKMLASALKPNYELLMATNGEKALEIASSEDPPDLILLDIVMPGMDGYTVCKHLKSNSETQKIPVIFITGKDSMENETMGFELGAADYITKPFRIPVVKARLRTQLDLKQKTDLLEKLAAVDGLTNIYNRRRFDEVFKQEWQRAIRKEQALSLLLMDIDYFKMYNDHYGHMAGDDCLKKVASIIKRQLQRPGDFAARYGGEEFVAVLPDTDGRGAAEVAEKIRNSIESARIPHALSKASSYITLSTGGATVKPLKNHSMDAFLKAADEALYGAKEAGRNRVKVT